MHVCTCVHAPARPCVQRSAWGAERALMMVSAGADAVGAV